MRKNLVNAKQKVTCKLAPLNIFLSNLKISFNKVSWVIS